MHGAGEHRESLSIVEKLLPVWIILSMVVGLGIGKLINASNVDLLPPVIALASIVKGTFQFDLGHIISLGIPIGLFLMIYPAMAKIHLEDVKKALTSGRAAGVVVFFNYAINPFLLWLFGWIFLRNHPDLWTGLVLLGVAPCIAMVLVWTDLAKGNNAMALTLMAWNSLIQMVTTPLFIFLIIGSRVKLDVSLIAESVILFLGLPLLIGVLTRGSAIKRKGEEWFEKRFVPVINKVQLIALLFTLVIMFSLKGDVIIAKPELIYLMAVPLILFFVTLFMLTFFVARQVKLNYEDSVAVGFNSTGRNFELAIAIALTAFVARPMVGVSTVVGPLIEVPVMLGLVYFAKRMSASLFAARKEPEAMFEREFLGD